jgi:hypothetical protein
MNKKLIAALIAITLAVPTTAHAAGLQNRTGSIPAVAVLDTAIDTSLPAFQGKIIQEVCILEWTTCPNGQSFMEGAGAASMPANLIKLGGFDHGTLMTSVFVKTNPNVNIVFIKIIGNTATGMRQNAGEAAVYNALNWVKANASKYNIQAVTMSQGMHNLGPAGTDYCPKTPTTQQSVKDLISIGIPTFFPSGNGRDYKRIDWPACLDESISVGYVDQQNEISVNSNNDSEKLDFFAPGFFTVPGVGNVAKNISGSSASIQVAGAQWIQLKSANPSYTYDQLLNAFRSTTSSTIGRQGKFNKLININGALAYKPVAVGPTPEELAAQKAAADAAAKAASQTALRAEIDKAIAVAQAEHDATVKAAADKLAAYKSAQLARLNG